jgi:hypothetical protein
MWLTPSTRKKMYTTAAILLSVSVVRAQSLHAEEAAVAAPAASSTCNVTPFSSDTYTALLDHFEGSTTGQASGSVFYTSGTGGLGKALAFGQGSSVVYSLGGWYGWTSDYTPDGKSGAIELWIKPHSSHGSGDFLTINWFDTSTPPGSGYITHLGLDASGRLYFGDWTSITNNPADMPFSPLQTVIPPLTWTHIAYIWGPNGTSIYVNGSLEATSSLNYYPALNSTVYVYLNGWGSNILSAVDEFRISTIARASTPKCAG